MASFLGTICVILGDEVLCFDVLCFSAHLVICLGIPLSVAFDMSSSNAEKAHRYEQKVRSSTSISCPSDNNSMGSHDGFAKKWVENEFL